MQVAAAVALKRATVGQGDVAVHPDDAPLGGTPRQYGGGVGVGAQHQVAFLDVEKPGDGGAVKADALLKGAGQLAGEQRQVFLVAEDIAEGEFGKFDVVILDKVEDILRGTLHRDLL